MASINPLKAHFRLFPFALSARKIEGHDRYASEILRYRFDVRELEERKEDAVCTTV